MSRPDGSARRSGDPRKRAAQEQAPSSTPGTPRQLAVALVAILGLAVLALVLLWPDDDQEPENAGLEHAEVACDLTVKADEAAEGESRARYAASVLLLDQAIISSARAADSDVAFSDLDDAVNAVHTAGHRGDPEEWEIALGTALAACGASID